MGRMNKKSRNRKASNSGELLAPSKKVVVPADWKVVVPVDWRKVVVPVAWMQKLGSSWMGLSKKARIGAYATFAAAFSFGGYAVAAAGHAGTANDTIDLVTTVYYFVTDHSGHVMADDVAEKLEEKIVPLYKSLDGMVVGLPISKADVGAAKKDQAEFERLVKARSVSLREALQKDPKLSFDADMLVQYLNRAHGCVEDGCNAHRISYQLSDVTCVVADLYGEFIFDKRKVSPNYGDNVIAARGKYDCKTMIYGKVS